MDATSPNPGSRQPGPARLLLLGGTTEASRLAAALAGRDDVAVITSLAGRTANPGPVKGSLRVGGFGGVEGLALYLREERIAAVVDATHPFSAVMRWHAFDACNHAGVPRLRLERPGWTAVRGDRWTVVPDLADAAATIASGPWQRVFLTTGRTELAAFVPASDGRRWWLVRSIDSPDPADLADLAPAEVVLDRGPFTVSAETALLAEHRIDLVVTKNSGGEATAAKLEAARGLGVEVLVVDRPPSPPGLTVATVDDAVGWVAGALTGLTG